MVHANKITIAIDGYASSGKSTLGKDLAKALGYIFIDSGAMYRGVAWFALEKGLFNERRLNASALIAILPEVTLHFSTDGSQALILNGQDVSVEIRSKEVSQVVSEVAAIGEVRKKLVESQRKIGSRGGIVMDGRDIGTVVFPEAELKLFVTADLETRSQRRFQEMQKNDAAATLQEVKENLLQRDDFDTKRAISPLIKAEDAIVFDTSSISREEQLKKALQLVKTVLGHEG
ncbi:MAG: (d)CMP kinase [Bacteroidetes bacterium]|nr:(d)CMP kinase [Bacteroidota bacterium]MBM3423961.1 (d)CMP kinase [Bacteroidota bacterium]